MFPTQLRFLQWYWKHLSCVAEPWKKFPPSSTSKNNPNLITAKARRYLDAVWVAMFLMAQPATSFCFCYRVPCYCYLTCRASYVRSAGSDVFSSKLLPHRRRNVTILLDGWWAALSAYNVVKEVVASLEDGHLTSVPICRLRYLRCESLLLAVLYNLKSRLFICLIPKLEKKNF